MPEAYYNEIDPEMAAWLRELIKDGHIANGVVDERDIREVQPADLAGFRQVHLFAGIGGWSLALRLAGWPDDRPVWTGSCPCQPFSSAGKRKGGADDRHLWPAMFRLIRECRPATVFGEQVPGAIAHGWLDGVCDNLEPEDYAIGAVVLPACSVGSPQIRARLWWVAIANGAELRGLASAGKQPINEHDARSGGLGDSLQPRLEGHPGHGNERDESRWLASDEAGPVTAAGPTGFWFPFDLIPCRDEKARRVEPGTFPLAHGVPARVVRLRGYGNAICPQIAAAFIQAFMNSEEMQEREKQGAMK